MMKLFPNRWGLGIFLICLGLNVFLLSSLAGGMSGAMAVERILKRRLEAVTAPLSAARQEEIAKALELALEEMKPEQAAVRAAQMRWLEAFEKTSMSLPDLQAHMQAIRAHREAANGRLHAQALAVIAGMSAEERQAVARQIRQRFDLPAAPAAAASTALSTPNREER